MKIFPFLVLFSLPLLCFCQTIKKKLTPQGTRLNNLFKEAYQKYDQQDYTATIQLTTQILNEDSADYFAYLLRSQAEYFSNNRDSGMKDVNMAVKLNPKFWEAYSWRAFMEPNDQSNAFEDLTMAIKYAHDNGDLTLCYYNRANVRIEQLDWRGAIEDCEKAILYAPDNYHAYSSKAQAEIEIEDFYGALRDCDKAISIHPGYDFYPYYYRGMAKAKLGKKESACDDFGEAKRLNEQSGTNDYRVRSAISTYCN